MSSPTSATQFESGHRVPGERSSGGAWSRPVGHAWLVSSRTSAAALDARVKNVLVPLDGSELALASLPTARVLAERFGADVHTISVTTSDADGERLRALGAAALGVAAGDDHVRVVNGGDVAESIVDRAAELVECVVCLSTHGRGRLGGAAIGSVARSLVQRSDRPVVALGPSADRPGWSPSPRWPAPLSVPRIVA
ncbi:MAG: universal stress protein, partial [Nocardioidaceae bacterium]